MRFDGLKWHYNYRLSQFDPANDQAYYIEVFNKGAAALAYQVKAKQDWIKLSQTAGVVATEERIFVSIDDEPPQILNLHDVKGIFGGVKPSYLGPPKSKRLN